VNKLTIIILMNYRICAWSYDINQFIYSQLFDLLHIFMLLPVTVIEVDIVNILKKSFFLYLMQIFIFVGNL